MRDFDTDRAGRAAVEQGFRIGGEQFQVKPGVHPSVLLDYEDSILLGRDDLLTSMDVAIKSFFTEEADAKRWDDLRERKADPVTVGDLRAIMNYLYEVEAELPTSAPAPSSNGRARTPRSSKAGTPSAAEQDS